jgi:biotin synthase
LAETIAGLSTSDLRFCASLGTLGAEDFEMLKRAGITRYHHNLETAQSHFGKICTTHAYADRMATIKAAKRSGMQVCAGGLFGIGETDDHVLELGLTLRRLDVDIIPVNFLIPVPGTRLEKMPRISALRCLKIIALLRYLLFDKPIIVCGGRMANLGRHHDRVFQAGASGIMTGDYLTAPGCNPSGDHAMIRELGLIAK